jgi:NAD(P)-dependent dehydrogenase (short-subunit alcohol dehydrogenase family)
MNFTDKVIVVTGGASGIGQAAAREFAACHGHVVILDRNDQAGRDTAEALRSQGHTAGYLRVDLAVSAEVQRAFDHVAAEHGGIDVLVNNAGIQRYGTATTTSGPEWDEVMDANLKSAFLASKYALPHMIRRGGGSIVITGSVQSLTAQRNSVAYVVSKHALLGLTRSLALDYAPDNIRVNCVCPGAIDTPMLRWAASLDDHPERVIEACRKLAPLGRLGRPEEIARVIVFLASDWASFISGAVITADGGLLAPTGGMASQETSTGGTRK